MYRSTITNEEIEKLPFAAFQGEINVIDSPNGDAYREAIEYLSSQRAIGFDTETKPCFVSNRPRNRVALLQLSGADKAYLFRLPKTGIPQDLADILSDKKIYKIGAAVGDDVSGLNRYANFKPMGFIDLQSKVEQFGIEQKSVKRMAAIILGVRISKSQQLSNWESSMLSPAQQKYAAIDAWICLQMWNRLCKEKRRCQNTAQ